MDSLPPDSNFELDSFDDFIIDIKVLSKPLSMYSDFFNKRTANLILYEKFTCLIRTSMFINF